MDTRFAAAIKLVEQTGPSAGDEVMAAVSEHGGDLAGAARAIDRLPPS